jgi:hypothetical protein
MDSVWDTVQYKKHLYKNYNSKVLCLSTDIVHCLCRANTDKKYRKIYVQEDTYRLQRYGKQIYKIS